MILCVVLDGISADTIAYHPYDLCFFHERVSDYIHVKISSFKVFFFALKHTVWDYLFSREQAPTHVGPTLPQHVTQQLHTSDTQAIFSNFTCVHTFNRRILAYKSIPFQNRHACSYIY